jgi:predicted glutamine amidotransferase
MCGIYAILDKTGLGIDAGDFNVFHQMAIMTQLRGMHNSGVFAVDKKKPEAAAKIVKTIGPSHNLAYEKSFSAWQDFVSKNAGAIVGHGRHATVGKIIKANAHPFKANHITLVHNGTIRSGIDKQHEEDVDSYGLCKQIAADGYVKALQSVNGAFAIVSHDEQQGKIIIARNYERPLAYLENKEAIYIMSHDKALDYLYQLNNGISYGKVESFLAGYLYEYDIKEGTLKKGESIERVYSYGTHPFTPKKVVYPVPTNIPTTTGLGGKATAPGSTSYIPGEDVIFQVKSIIPPQQGRPAFVYVCADEEGNKIFFKTDKRHEEYIDLWGCGSVCMVSRDNGEIVYQIKTRSIEWDTIAPEEDEKVNFVVLSDGEVIEKSKWRSLCEKSHCYFCAGPVYENENEDSLAFEKDGDMMLVCRHCLKNNLSLFDKPRRSLYS